MKAKGFIFDLDGVIADTAKYHFLAWKKLASELGFEFEEKHNEHLKGVSRMASLEVVLKAGNISGLSDKEKEVLAHRKNNYYLEMISSLDKNEILPGIEAFLVKLKAAHIKIALGSASKSGKRILEQLELLPYFDAVVDGNLVTKPKPDSQVFLTAADLMQLPYHECVVIEDASAGVKAAKNGGMRCIGIGEPHNLMGADLVLEDTSKLVQINL